MARRAIITGISGQDGSYLAEFLVSKGYDVHGTVRPELLTLRQALPGYLTALGERVTLHPGSLDRPSQLVEALCAVLPEEIYHLAGPSTVDSGMLGDPALLSQILGSTRALLDAIATRLPSCRLFFAGSSEMFGRPTQAPQDEDTAFHPRSIYGLAKLAGYHAVRQARRGGIFACTGILYNHESPRRPPVFLPRKVTMAAARIKLGLQERVGLGNLDAVRDWGSAPEFVEAMWLMLQHDEPRDFVIATGRTHSVRDLVDLAFGAAGLDYRKHVDVDPRFFRPAEAVPLRGNAERLLAATGWQPRTGLADIVREMVAQDLADQGARLRPS
jgi:GDPmannose 4,6-dehydratase